MIELRYYYLFCNFVNCFICCCVKVVNPLSAEPAKSVNSKDNSLSKKLKEIDGTAISTGSGNSEKTR